MSLGGKKTTETKIDPTLERAAKENLAMAKNIAQIGFIPYQGDTVAGFQPGQISAMNNTNTAASAFGLDQSAVPQAGNLNPYAAYQQAIASIPKGQRDAINALFINPMTGAAPTYPGGNSPPQNSKPILHNNRSQSSASAKAMEERAINKSRGTMNESRGTSSMATPGAYMPGGLKAGGGIFNRIAAEIRNAISPQQPPTAANRPVARPTLR